MVDFSDYDFSDYRNGLGPDDWLRIHMTRREYLAVAAARTWLWAEPTKARPLGYLLYDYWKASPWCPNWSNADPFQTAGDASSPEQHALLLPIANMFRGGSRSSRCQLVIGTHASFKTSPGGVKALLEALFRQCAARPTGRQLKALAEFAREFAFDDAWPDYQRRLAHRRLHRQMQPRKKRQPAKPGI